MCPPSGVEIRVPGLPWRLMAGGGGCQIQKEVMRGSVVGDTTQGRGGDLEPCLFNFSVVSLHDMLQFGVYEP